jgi:hypothetical protein
VAGVAGVAGVALRGVRAAAGAGTRARASEIRASAIGVAMWP